MHSPPKKQIKKKIRKKTRNAIRGIVMGGAPLIARHSRNNKRVRNFLQNRAYLLGGQMFDNQLRIDPIQLMRCNRNVFQSRLS